MNWLNSYDEQLCWSGHGVACLHLIYVSVVAGTVGGIALAAMPLCCGCVGCCAKLVGVKDTEETKPYIETIDISTIWVHKSVLAQTKPGAF